jgi:hypothetical protein
MLHISSQFDCKPSRTVAKFLCSTWRLLSWLGILSTTSKRQRTSYMSYACHSFAFQNSSELGLESVSELSQADEALRCISSSPHPTCFISELGVLVAVTSQYASRNPRTSKPHLRLCGVDLLFSWLKTEDDPFAEHCPLPYMSLLDDVLHRFATFQLARLVLISVINDSSGLLMEHSNAFRNVCSRCKPKADLLRALECS